MTTLIELVHELREVLAEVDDADGELSDDLEQRLDAAEAALSCKAEACLRYAADLDALAAARKARAEALRERADSAAAKAKRLREWVRGAAIRAGLKHLEAGDFAVTIAKPSKSVAIEDVAAFVSWAIANRPDLVKEVPAEWRPMKVEIKAAIKAGDELPGCALVDGEPGLRVR